MKSQFKNRYDILHEFIRDENHDIIWKGDFKWCRYSEDFVDPSGGPFINKGLDLKKFGFPNYIVDRFEIKKNNYKIITKKCPMCHLAGGTHKMDCETRKVTILLNNSI
jgi:hypothetical protein